MNPDTYGAIKRDQQRIIDKYEDIISSIRVELEIISYKVAGVKICYETLRTILDENPCPACGSNDQAHQLGCEMYEVMTTLREIVEELK